MYRTLWGLGLAALFLECAALAHAGIADSRIPAPFTQNLYSVPGVINAEGLATYFMCTSTASSNITVGVEVFDASGGSPLDDASASGLSVAPGATVIFTTGDSADAQLGAQILPDAALGIPTPTKGSARILSTSRALVCTAFVSDSVNVPTKITWQLPVILKTKQKAAS